jgi:methylenetetrahydrofolate dehydrogenase (NADP+)/methenyltetrahydrofolate cyclohydrolase
MKILDGRKLRDSILEEVKKEVAQLSFVPLFTDIVIGDDPASLQYARMKKKTAEALGFGYVDAFFPSDTPAEKLFEEIARLSALPHMAGIIIQLPIPAHLPQKELLDAIPPALDVDVLGAHTEELFYSNQSSLILPTAHAVMKLLDEAGADYARHSFVVVGRGALVGKPVIHLLQQKGAQVDVITRSTSVEEKMKLFADADVIVSATGVAKLITGDMVKEGVIVVDAGTSESSGAIVGDVDFDTVAPRASHITPTPGGVGPVTVGCLFMNVLAVAKTL